MPIKKSEVLISLLLLFNSIVSIIFYFNCQWSFPEDYTGIYIFFSIFDFIIILIYYFYNLIFMIRILFIGIMGIVPIVTIYLGKYFSFRSLFSQTYDIAFLMLLLSNIALFSSHIGFLISEKIKIINHREVNRHGLITIIFVFLITILSAYFIGKMRGEFVFNVSYGSQKGHNMPLKNLNTISMLGIAILIFYYFTARYKGRVPSFSRKLFYMIIFSVLYTFVWNEFLRGARMDPLTGIFLLLILYRIYSTEKVNITLKQLLLLGVLFIIIQAWGYFRWAMVHGINIDQLKENINIFESKYSSRGVPVLFFQGTLNNLYVTISTTMYAIKHGIIGYWYGRSYLDYILRTPPKFIYPNRPGSLAWLPVKIFGQNASAGGYTELAEVYLNFGIWGAFFMPAIISFLIGLTYKLFIRNKYSLRYSIPFFSVLSVYFRGNLYQTFAFYKAFITGIVLYISILLIRNIVEKRKVVILN